MADERTQLVFDSATQDDTVRHRIIVDLVEAQASVICQGATGCGKGGNKARNLESVSVLIPSMILRKMDRTYTTLWNTSQIKRHLGLMSVSLIRAIGDICKRKSCGRVRTGAEGYLRSHRTASSLKESEYGIFCTTSLPAVGKRPVF